MSQYRGGRISGALNVYWVEVAEREVAEGEFITNRKGIKYSVVGLAALRKAALGVEFYAVQKASYNTRRKKAKREQKWEKGLL